MDGPGQGGYKAVPTHGRDDSWTILVEGSRTEQHDSCSLIGSTIVTPFQGVGYGADHSDLKEGVVTSPGSLLLS